MAPATTLGELEFLVLLAVLRLGEGAYAVPVREEIMRRTGRELSRGAVSVTLDRLERKGCMYSRLGAPTAERGGKAKRLYTPSAAGLQALRTTLDGTRAMLDGLAPERVGAPLPR